MANDVSGCPPSTWLYDLILLLFSPLLDLFFREIQFRGAWRIPTSGAIILVAAPHANQFVDSLILMRAMRSANRRISWLMAAKSFKTPVIGYLARGVGALPVERAMDRVKKGAGRIYLHNASSRVFRGVATRLDGVDYVVGGTIYFEAGGDDAKVEIKASNGPEELIVKALPAREIVEILRNTAGVESKISPKIDQTAVYETVFEHLSGHGCVGIFPEGGSHDRSDLLSLKAGVAVMALGALAQGTDVSIVPVGLTYFHPHKFRSRAVVEFGDPVAVSNSVIKDFQSGKKRESIGSLLSSIHQSLIALTMTTPDFETMMLVRAARRLYTSKREQLPLSAITEINRRLIKGYTTHSSDPEIQSLKRSITQYSRQLDELNLRDHQVKYARLSTLRIITILVHRIIKLTLLAIGTLPGLLLFSPVFIVARYYSHKKTREALAGSSVKIKGHDVMATWKILVAGGLAPVLYSYYALIVATWTWYNNINKLLPPSISIYMVVVAAYTVFPPLTYAALRLGETGMDILKSIRPLVLCLSPKSKVLVRLRRRREELARWVVDVVDRLGPELFLDCEAEKVPFPRRIYGDVSPFESLGEVCEKDGFL